MTAEEIRHATRVASHLNTLTEHMINGWSSIRAEVKEEIWLYCHLEMTVIDGTVMNSRRIVIQTSLQHIALEQLHINQ